LGIQTVWQKIRRKKTGTSEEVEELISDKMQQASCGKREQK